MEPKIIVGIPGSWANRDALVAAAAQVQPLQYMLAGPSLIHLPTKTAFLVELEGPNPEMAHAFAVASGGRLDEALLERIRAHTMTVYLVGEPGCRGARDMLAAAAFLLDAGGMAVKVESAGLAHAPHIWRGFARRGDTLAAYDAMVTLVGGSKGAYSCGMHNFGLADAGTEEVPTEEVPELLTAFNQWNLLARPALESGSVFARSLSEPAVALRHEGFGYDEDSILNNPHGKWSLQPTDQVVDPAKPDTEDGPLFLLMDHTSEPHRRATAQAQSTLWRLAEFGSNPTSWGQALVKFCIEHDDDRAHMWAVLESMEDEAVVASLFEVPPEFPNHTPGNPVTVPFDAVEDWAIRRHGSVIGGFTLQLQAQSVSEEHRRWQQLYTGNLAFLPTDELMAPTPGPIEAPVPQQSDNVPWWRRLMPW